MAVYDRNTNPSHSQPATLLEIVDDVLARHEAPGKSVCPNRRHARLGVRDCVVSANGGVVLEPLTEMERRLR